MMRPSPELDTLERRYVRVVITPMSYHEVLARFAALWAEALKLDPDFPRDSEEDVQGDLTLARVLRALPG